MVTLPESIFGVVECNVAGAIFWCVQLAESRGRMRLDMKMWLWIAVSGRGF